jgi:hypothetical protein
MKTRAPRASTHSKYLWTTVIMGLIHAVWGLHSAHCEKDHFIGRLYGEQTPKHPFVAAFFVTLAISVAFGFMTLSQSNQEQEHQKILTKARECGSNLLSSLGIRAETNSSFDMKTTACVRSSPDRIVDLLTGVESS